MTDAMLAAREIAGLLRDYPAIARELKNCLDDGELERLTALQPTGQASQLTLLEHLQEYEGKERLTVASVTRALRIYAQSNRLS